MGTMRDRVNLNVSGRTYMTTLATLATLPETKLYKVCSKPEDYPDFYKAEQNEFYFDRNPQMIIWVLGLYRTGRLHLPSDLCSEVIKRELEFWEIPESRIANCCWVQYIQNQDSVTLATKYVEALREMMVMGYYAPVTWKDRMWSAMEYPFHSKGAKIWNAVSLTMVLLAVIVVIISFSPDYRDPINKDDGIDLKELSKKDPFTYYGQTKAKNFIFFLDCFFLVFFLVELIIRVVSSPDRFHLFKSKTVLIDIVVVLLYAIVVARRLLTRRKVAESVQNFVNIVHMLIPLRALRIINFMQKMAISKMFVRSVHRSALQLVIVVVTSFTCIIVFGAIVFSIERITDTRGLTTLPEALWWSVATVTTVGYGDVYPHSNLGRLVAGIALVVSIVFISMPTAVILASFSRAHTIVNSMIVRTNLQSTRRRRTVISSPP